MSVPLSSVIAQRTTRGLRPALAVALIMSGFGQSACAADGDLDPSFGSPSATPGVQTGYITIDFGNGSNGHQDGAHRLLRQPDGKFVAVGSVDTGGASQGIGLARILNSGQIDTSFGDLATPGRSITPGSAGTLLTGNAVAVLPSGQLVVAATAYDGADRGRHLGFPANGGNPLWNTGGDAGSAYNDVVVLPDGRLLAGGKAQGTLYSNSGDFSLVLHDGAGVPVDQLAAAFDLGSSHNDMIQRIAFVSATDAVSGRLGYVYAIGSVELPNYPGGHLNIECGIIKAGLYATAPRLRLEPSFGTANSGKLVLNVNSAWSAGNIYASEGNASCRGISVRKDGSLIIAGERYYFGYDNTHATADDSMGFAAKLDANGAADPTFHNGSYGGGFAFYFNYVASLSGYYMGLWFSLAEGDGLPLLGGLTSVPCDSMYRNRSWVLRTAGTGSQDASYSDFSCDTPRSATDTGYDDALDGVFDAGRVVTVGNVFSSIKPGSATDFIFMRHLSDRIFTDNLESDY